MLDSPYMRRMVILLRLLRLPFEHAAVSILRHFDQFSATNSAVKTPMLVCDDGAALTDSTLIIDYAEILAGRSLIFAVITEHRHVLCVTDLTLVACEKAVQVVYEHNLCLSKKVRGPWVERVRGQLLAAVEVLEAKWRNVSLPVEENELTQTDVTVVVAWAFIQLMATGHTPAVDYPRLAACSVTAEQLGAFRELSMDAV